jgi:1,4-alpha-glucan branching enzyme
MEASMIRREQKGDRIRVTFALPGHEPTGRVSVVGDFNGWTPGAHVLRRRTNGTRSVAVQVPRGTALRFRYLGEGGIWFDDPDIDARHDRDGIVHV